MSKPRPLIAGNWKMNGRRADGLASPKGIVEGAGGLKAELLLCPPATLLALVGEAIKGSSVSLWAARIATRRPAGPIPGDIGAPMLADLGCRYVILGHSERRAEHKESDALVKAKAGAALAAGLIPIVCLGESEAERDRGEALAVVARQLAGSLPDGAAGSTVVVAYEPIWAIGTGRTASTADIGAVHGHLRSRARQALRRCRQLPAALRRLGQAVQLPGHPGAGQCRWGAGGRGQPEGGRLPRHRPGLLLGRAPPTYRWPISGKGSKSAAPVSRSEIPGNEPWWDRDTSY